MVAILLGIAIGIFFGIVTVIVGAILWEDYKTSHKGEKKRYEK